MSSPGLLRLRAEQQNKPDSTGFFRIMPTSLSLGWTVYRTNFFGMLLVGIVSCLFLCPWMLGVVASWAAYVAVAAGLEVAYWMTQITLALSILGWVLIPFVWALDILLQLMGFAFMLTVSVFIMGPGFLLSLVPGSLFAVSGICDAFDGDPNFDLKDLTRGLKKLPGVLVGIIVFAACVLGGVALLIPMAALISLTASIAPLAIAIALLTAIFGFYPFFVASFFPLMMLRQQRSGASSVLASLKLSMSNFRSLFPVYLMCLILGVLSLIGTIFLTTGTSAFLGPLVVFVPILVVGLLVPLGISTVCGALLLVTEDGEPTEPPA